MSKIRLAYALTFLSGLLLGWLALGWWLWPVAYVGDAYTYELNQTDKLAYTSAVVDSFSLTGLANPAWFAQWTPAEVNQALEQVIQHNPAKANWARALANQVSVSMTQPVQVKTQNQASETIPTDGLVNLASILVLVSFAVGGFLVWRSRQANRQPAITSLEQAFVERQTTEYIPVQPKSQSAPLAHARLDFGPGKPTDQHFPIESQQEGEPSLGEFGVNQVEGTMAWDVWLFDQKALVTVTKVLADQGSDELAGRGEVIGWGAIMLGTPNLSMTGKVINLHVMQEAPTTRSFTVDLTVEAKEE